MSVLNGSDDMQQTNTQGPAFYGDLEEYLSEVEKRTQICAGDDDVYGQLAQREKDLVLAAELGKALLEKNEEISRANERLAEEYSLKLELLEQEKHGLRRKLEVLEGEYESRVAELQSDLVQLRKDLSQQHQLHRTAEKEKGQLLEELTQQNHRLTSELKQAARVEDQLQSQLQSMREQFNVRRSNLHDHVSQLEGLREEINLLSERKSELERRINALSDEREGLNVSLEESSDKIMLLEKRNQEQEIHLRAQERDLEQLRQTNNQLQNRLDSILLLKRSSPTPGGTNSLLDEIEMMSDTSSQNNQIGRTKLAIDDVIMHQDDDDDDIECDDDLAALYQHSPIAGGQMLQLQQELVPIYHQLRRLCEDLRRRRDDCSFADSGISSSPEELQAHHIRFGMLTTVTKELKGLIEESFTNNEDETPCMSCQAILEEREVIDRMQKELSEKNEELKQKTEEINNLTTKLTIQETELATLRESRDQLQNDMSHSDLAKDQVVKKAWEVRDQAVARKNAVEIELAKTRIDVLHINSQLMEAVQQKVELSQQLEQWQMDMAVLLDTQVIKQLKTQEAEDKKRHEKTDIPQETVLPTKRPTPSKSKLFGLWR